MAGPSIATEARNETSKQLAERDAPVNAARRRIQEGIDNLTEAIIQHNHLIEPVLSQATPVGESREGDVHPGSSDLVGELNRYASQVEALLTLVKDTNVRVEL